MNTNRDTPSKFFQANNDQHQASTIFENIAQIDGLLRQLYNVPNKN
jgi:hypothetical protein